jgi:sec-independent protein translocase protein TatA
MFEGLLQPSHLMLILVIALIVLGPGKLGDLGGQLGRGIREFKQNIESPSGPAALGAGGMRHCTQCGVANPAASRFCSACGAAAGQPTA